MKAIVLSNVPHYHHLARALHEAGFLKRYITSISPLDGRPAPAWLPPHWRQKLEGRRLQGIPPGLVRRIWLSEALQRGLPALRLASAERSTWINNHLFDWLAKSGVERCDVFHFVSSVGLYCARKAKAFGATVICDSRQEHPHFQTRLLRQEAERFGLRTDLPGSLYEGKLLEELEVADRIVVPSGYSRATFVSEGFDEDKIEVIPYGVDVGLFRPSKESSVFTVLFVGHITLRKGVQYLLQAIRKLRAPDIKVVLIGSIDPAMRPILCRYSGLFEHVPAVSKPALARYYASSSVLVLPSLADSFGLVVFEAMACGIPVIITEHTGAKEVIRDAIDGFVVPIRDPEALREKIALLYENPSLRSEMGASAVTRARQLTWSAYGDRVVDFYARLASQQSGYQNVQPHAGARVVGEAKLAV